MKQLCEHLPWDSKFFGFPVAKVVSGTISAAECRAILDWCRDERVRFLYYLADDDIASWAAASAGGFQVVDVRVKLVLDRTWPRLPAPGLSPEVVLREATADDLPALLPIATSVHTDSRFFADPAVPREKAAELFSLWLRRSIDHSIADVVFVAEVDGVAVSYISAKVADGIGTIGVVGVGAEARGRGVGMAMVQRTLGWFADAGTREVSVVTQARNVMAQRVYQRCGFLTASTNFWYHRWLS